MKRVITALMLFLVFVFVNGIEVRAEDIKKKETKVEKNSKKFFKKKEKEAIEIEDFYALGTPHKIKDLPEGMIKAFGESCIQFYCRTNKATTIMSKSFSKGEGYNGRHPDNMIKAMAYFELFYMGQLRKNKKALVKYKKYLEQKFSHNFITTSDSEVLLYLLIYLGIDKTLTELDGIFAFGFYDRRLKKLVLARDRAGVKPIYYTISDNLVLFSSVIHSKV